jgi:elongation factor G
VVDVLTQKAYIWDDSGDPLKYEVSDVPEDMVELVAEYREKLIEAAIEMDEDLMMSYLEDGVEPSIDELKRCIRLGTIGLNFFPTYCGSAFKNKGVQNILDAVVDYLPNPTEVEPQEEVDIEGNPTGGLALVDASKPLLGFIQEN